MNSLSMWACWLKWTVPYIGDHSLRATATWPLRRSDALGKASAERALEGSLSHHPLIRPLLNCSEVGSGGGVDQSSDIVLAHPLSLTKRS